MKKLIVAALMCVSLGAQAKGSSHPKDDGIVLGPQVKPCMVRVSQYSVLDLNKITSIIEEPDRDRVEIYTGFRYIAVKTNDTTGFSNWIVDNIKKCNS